MSPEPPTRIADSDLGNRDPVGVYYGTRDGRDHRIRVGPLNDGYEILWTDGRRVTIQSASVVVEDPSLDPLIHSVRFVRSKWLAMRRTVWRYLKDWNARNVQEIVAAASSS